MTAKAQMVRWGNSLAIRIPKSLAEEAKLKEGDTLTLKVGTQGIVTPTSRTLPVVSSRDTDPGPAAE